MFGRQNKRVALTVMLSAAMVPAFLLFSHDALSRAAEEPQGTPDSSGEERSYWSTASGNVAQTPVPALTLSNPRTLKIGLHTENIRQFFALEQRLGVVFDMVAVHIHWGNANNFPEDVLRHFSGTGKTVFVFWNPMDYTKTKAQQSDFYYRQILSGVWDPYIEEFARQVASYEGQVIIAPFEEVNGEWVPWSGYAQRYGSVEEYKEAFRYLRGKFRDVPNAQFAWVTNNVSDPDTPENQAGVYYPGSAYVDIVGINGFNFGDPWASFDDIFSDAIAEARQYGKPIYLTSLASAEGPQKAQWIQEFLNSTLLTQGVVSGWLWFNEDKERDWRIDSDETSEATFRENLLQLKLNGGASRSAVL